MHVCMSFIVCCVLVSHVVCASVGVWSSVGHLLPVCLSFIVCVSSSPVMCACVCVSHLLCLSWACIVHGLFMHHVWVCHLLCVGGSFAPCRLAMCTLFVHCAWVCPLLCMALQFGGGLVVYGVWVHHLWFLCSPCYLCVLVVCCLCMCIDHLLRTC